MRFRHDIRNMIRQLCESLDKQDDPYAYAAGLRGFASNLGELGKASGKADAAATLADFCDLYCLTRPDEAPPGEVTRG